MQSALALTENASSIGDTKAYVLHYSKSEFFLATQNFIDPFSQLALQNITHLRISARQVAVLAVAGVILNNQQGTPAFQEEITEKELMS